MSGSSLARAKRTGVREKLIAHLRDRIEASELLRGQKVPSRSVLALQFNVSLPTISLAYKALLDEGLLEFTPGKGIYVSMAGKQETRRFTIGLIGWFASHCAAPLPRFNTYWLGIFKSLVHHAGQRGYSITVIPETDKEPLDIDWVLAHRPHVLISHGIRLNPATISEFRRRGMPLLLGNRYLEQTPASYVDYNVAGGFQKVVRIFRERGHQRIGALVAKGSIPEAQERWKRAFFMELGMSGCACDCTPYWRVVDIDHSRQTTEVMEKAGRRETLRLLDMREPPTALYCLPSQLSVGAARAVASRGLKIGKEMSIITDVSFEEDSPFSMMLDPHDELAEQLVETAKKLADNPHETYQVEIPKRYVDKGSVATLRKGGAAEEILAVARMA